ncbi:MAG: ABC transporter ATP-binding protein [Candidatus Brockarchaeota archaeon]|nr:ABC transporter ATP-binding protein [Candidatus Brockarchaeota archaeon]
MSSGEKLLELEDLRKWFEIRRGLLGSKTSFVKAVDGVTFSLEEGKAVSLVGESGSGKTTLGKTILRLYEPNNGKILFQGKNVTHIKAADLKWYRRMTGLVQQDPFGAFASHFTIFRSLEEPLLIHNTVKSKEERAEKVFKALEEVRLTPVEDFAYKYPHMLSGGQLQRVAIARAIILEPKLIVADEPVSMLDASVRIEILTLLRRLQERLRLSVIYITHDLATTRFFSEWALIMYAGHVMEKASTQEVLRNPLHPYTRALLTATPEPNPGNRNKFKEVPPGEPPVLIDPPKSCRFSPRCPRAFEKCFKEEPPEFEAASGHWVKCWLYERPEGK